MAAAAGTAEQNKALIWTPKSGELIAWAPQPGPQTALLSCPYDEILYGGAKGGGKSDGLLGDWLGHMGENRIHRRYARGIIFRKAYPDLEQLISRSKEIFGPLGAVWKEQKKTWFFRGGATLKFRFVETKKDASKYQGHEYTFMGFDEVGEIADPEIIDTLRGALRNSKGVRALLLLTGNPLGVGHKWLVKRFIKGKKAFQPTIETMKTASGKLLTWSSVFIPAKLEDNPILMLSDPGYEMRLQQMCVGKPGLYKALRYGDWTAKLENPGALLTIKAIDDNRLSSYDDPDMDLICVAIDPSGSGNPSADECGISVTGCKDRHKYVLEDLSIQGPPKVWATRAIKAWYRWKANYMVAETNFGGDMVLEVIAKYDDAIKVEKIVCSRGKHVRAEPAAAEYERGYVHHVGEFEKLEEEWTTWVPNTGMKSPNRLDAAVFGLHKLSNGSDGLNIRDL